ncbi:uncharacterized protein KY384_007300 [Bacidia gigantensis]|uniref:uncharacterized protein n=1 Tax=Bacidia gigantensis TaxID=2732470 RepID=UPI001D0464FF|nr:uncharacterized protein KY384_007300 [Bacidia gigantensis]KAG8528382.1 hypothetical protein KY384_007300 [Bacidia gigantensis]
MHRIGVFPASGKLGTSIYTHLSKHVDPADVILISRNPDKIAPEVINAGAATRQADYDDLESLHHVFKGISHLVLISYPSLEIEHRVEAHKTAIIAAVAAGVSHIFYTSLAFGGDCTPTSIAHVMQAHLQTEAYLKLLMVQKPGFSFTAIREGLYAESFPMYMGFPDLRGSTMDLRILCDGKGPGLAWASIDDLGEATAKLVERYCKGRDVREYENRVVLLSGPRAYSLAETVQILGSIAGDRMAVHKVGIDEYACDPVVQDNLDSHGEVDVPLKWATSFKAVEAGETAVPSKRLERLLGRRPETFEKAMGRMIREAHKGK